MSCNTRGGERTFPSRHDFSDGKRPADILGEHSSPDFEPPATKGATFILYPIQVTPAAEGVIRVRQRFATMGFRYAS